MNFYRQTIKDAPSAISILKEFRNRDVEIIILPLDVETENGAAAQVDANGYPIGFFEETAGSLPDFPEREPHPVQSEREAPRRSVEDFAVSFPVLVKLFVRSAFDDATFFENENHVRIDDLRDDDRRAKFAENIKTSARIALAKNGRRSMKIFCTNFVKLSAPLSIRT